LKIRNRYDRSAGSYRRGRPQKRVSSDAFLIVTEGEVTEPEYLNALVSALRMSAIDVEVAHSTTGSDPFSVVAHAEKRVTQQRRDARNNPAVVPYDQIWVVFDREGINDGRDWQNAIYQAEAKGFKVALSNPSFEFWLLLHFVYTTAQFEDSAAVERRLKKENKGYAKIHGQVDYASIYLPLIEVSVLNSRKVRVDHDKTGADNPYTAVDKLVVALNRAVQKHNRLFEGVSG